VLVEHDAAAVADLRAKIEITDSFHSLVYLPVYIANYSHEGKQYAVIISGQTGAIQGERPYGLPIGSLFSWWTRNHEAR